MLVELSLVGDVVAADGDVDGGVWFSRSCCGVGATAKVELEGVGEKGVCA